MLRKIYLQLFADGAGAAPASEGSGTATEASVNGAPLAAQKEDLSKVIYGKADPKQGIQEESTSLPEDKAKKFEQMIKKDGEFHEEFTKRTQDIINKRFKESKQMEDTLKSHQGIFDILAEKYKVDASDPEAIINALNADDSLWEQEAYEMGIPVETYKRMKQLERENANLLEARRQREEQAMVNDSFARWARESEEFKSRYGIDFDFETECQNPDFVRMLGNGISVESAYKALHIDEMLNGAMAVTAKNVEAAVVNSITARAGRPSENGFESSNNSTIFKNNVSEFTNEDMDEIIRRAERGERVVL